MQQRAILISGAAIGSTENKEPPTVGHLDFFITDGGELLLVNDRGQKFKLKMVPVEERGEADEYPPNGLMCPNCYAPQFETPAGAVCMNGHGGITGIPERR